MDRKDRIYALHSGGRAILAFPAKDSREAQSLLREAWLRDDLRTLKSAGIAVWDGAEKLSVRPADAAEIARFEQEAKTLPDDEDDLQIVYLVPRD
jgi:hypothetical protein